MKEKLIVALLQVDLIWENPPLNRSSIERKILEEKSKVDLFILPEMFTSGFTMKPQKVSETMDGESIIWLKGLSKIKNAAICGSLVVSEKKCFYNRFIFVEPDGTIRYYDKRHTFNMAGEGEYYCSGFNKGLIKYNGWKILLRICYDLRFPVWSRNIDNYDILIYTANWPSPRINAWDNLLKARAIENVSYCVGVNRIGLDNNKNDYPGHSVVIDPLGNESLNIKNKEGVYVTTLDKNHLSKTRNYLPFLEDKDSFILE